MSRGQRWALGALTATPLLSLIIAVGAGTMRTVAPEAVDAWPSVALAVGIYHVILTGMMVLFYLGHLFRYSGLDRLTKSFWTLGLVFMAPVTMLFYWATEILPGPKNVLRWDTVEDEVHVVELDVRDAAAAA